MEDKHYTEPPAKLVSKIPEYSALHERSFRTGVLPEERLIALRDAISLCSWCRVPPPKWLEEAVTELCHKQILADRRPGRLGSYRARFRQHRIHLVRWAAVRHLRDNCRDRARTWDHAYAEASRELRGTIAQGSEEAIAASYKAFGRNSLMRSLRKDGENTLAETVRTYFEARDVLLDIDRIFDK